MPEESINERTVLEAIRASLAHAEGAAESDLLSVDVEESPGRVVVTLTTEVRDGSLVRALIESIAAIDGVNDVEVSGPPTEERARAMFDEEMEIPADRRRAHVIGTGEVGTRLGDALERADWTVLRVTRSDGWEGALDPDDRAPRIVAVREEDLGACLDRLGEGLRDRTMLVQNGFLEAVHGPLGPVSRGLIWFMSKGEVYHQLTSSLFYGPVAPLVARGLRDGGLDVAAVADGEAAIREMILKGIWNCVVGLPLAVLETDLETFLGARRDEAGKLVGESARAASAEYGVEVSTDEAMTVLAETTRPIGWVRGGKKALAWRNGAIAKFGRTHGVPTPLTDELLDAAGHDPSG